MPQSCRQGRLASRTFAISRRCGSLGDGIVLGVDPNTGWTVADTISAINGMAPMGLGYCEQPVDRRDIKGLAEIRAQSTRRPLWPTKACSRSRMRLPGRRARSGCLLYQALQDWRAASWRGKFQRWRRHSDIRINCGGLAVASQLEAAAAAHFCACVREEDVRRGRILLALGTLGRGSRWLAECGFKIKDGTVRYRTGPGWV